MKKQLNIYLKISSILLLSGVFFYLYFTFDPILNHVLFPKCPSYSILGIVCPGCGSQRAIHQLLHFNFKDAFLYNPLLLVSLPFLLYLIGILLYNFVFNTKKRISILYSVTFSKILLVVILVYFVLRNLPFSILKFLNPNN